MAMAILEKKKTDSKLKPLKIHVLRNDNVKLWITLYNQKYHSVDFIKNHGCSILSASYLCQYLGHKATPAKVYKKAKKYVKGSGCKLAMGGVKQIVDKICGGNHTKAYAVTKKNIDSIMKIIDDTINKNGIVSVEEKSPIHTVTVVGKDTKGNYLVANYGKIQTYSKAKLKKKLNRGNGKLSKWFSSSDKDAGIVVCLV